MSEVMSTDDSELEEIRAARRAEIQRQIEARADEQLQSEEQQAVASQEASALAEAMRIILTPEARQRLANVELTREDVALGVKRHLVNMHNEGRLNVPVDDQTLKAVLARLNSNRRDSKIRRI
ncbi:MAG TPA: DNA-binding protein [Candidatus Thalassarchaeaceae archaeon]|nr:DNA-binding protein [Candidatus Thalassarchaeaceae archaeon]HJM19756.1 DNA-binding protein [Candidatus Thalassarchaeaceae archaeon]